MSIPPSPHAATTLLVNDDTSQMQYEWIDPRQAVLRRPDSLVGSVQPRPVERIVLGVDGQVSRVQTSVSPAVEKVFDEIIVNAIDHRVRDDKMTRVQITIEQSGHISISNDGSSSIPTTDWPGTTIPTPQVLFHELHSGSNLDDSKRQAVGGRNGVGATITNYMSTFFQVQICNPTTQEEYTQIFQDNGGIVGVPVRTRYKGKTFRTTFSFTPDYVRLGCQVPLDPAVVQLLVGRAMDATACTPAQIYVNGTKISARSLKQYATMFGGQIIGSDQTTAEDSDHSAIGMQMVVTDKTDPPMQMCFVNGVRCVGTLLDACMRQITSRIKTGLPPRVVSTIVAEKMSVFITARLRNPSFGSQAKDVLDVPVSKMGFALPPCNTLCKKVEKMPEVQAAIQQRQQQSEGRAVTKLIKNNIKGSHVAKHERATKLGIKGAQNTLWIAEGDSAKQMILSGFSVIGRTFNGVFPLRGKLLNVHDVAPAVAMKSQTILDLVSILGLELGKEYDAASVKKVVGHHYHRLMIVTDQDHDGSHITGLIFAVFNRFFPSFLKHAPWFLNRFVTPVIRVRVAGSGTLDFFSMAEHRTWFEGRDEATAPRIQGVDYYKGLGTSTTEEAIQYYSDLPKHSVRVAYTPASSDAIAIFFAKERIDDRRALLKSVDPYSCVDYSKDEVTMENICYDELIHFSHLSLQRAIPSVVDGLKPATRKILYQALRHPASKFKVEQFAGEVVRDTCYHHGATSLEAAIVGMAQTFCGSNNVNLLLPLGQYGNRHGEKAASPRYVFTALNRAVLTVFRPEDTDILELLEGDGKLIEPRYFCPIVPMVLINGAEGIGTGYSTKVLAHNPADVLRACRTLALAGVVDAPLPEIRPWVRHFTGSIEADGSAFLYRGIHRILPPDDKGCVAAHITELPPQVKSNDAKTYYSEMDGVVDVIVNSKNDTVDLTVVFENAEALPGDIVKRLKLVERETVANMHLFDDASTLVRYESAEDILRAHGRVRLAWYARRIAHQMSKAEQSLTDVLHRIDLIERVLRNEIIILGVRRKALENQVGTVDARILLRMSGDDFTLDEIESRRKEVEALRQTIERLRITKPEDEWLRELDELALTPLFCTDVTTKKRHRESSCTDDETRNNVDAPGSS